jgi:predicted metal-dependent hydrolase
LPALAENVVGILTERFVIDEIPVEIRRNSRRKTRIGLGFDPAGCVILDAPVNASLSELEAVISEHGRWLRRRLQAVQRDAVCVASPRYQNGELLQYLGHSYELVVKEGKRSVDLVERTAQLSLFPGMQGIRGKLEIRLPDPQPASVATLMRRWYVGQAKKVFSARLDYWSKLPWLGGRQPGWRTRFMRSQWGSCSVDGKISLNTHLVKTPEPVIDYVVLHELCHLEHHNHSRRFYALLGTHMPDWQRRREALDRYLPVLLHP